MAEEKSNPPLLATLLIDQFDLIKSNPPKFACQNKRNLMAHVQPPYSKEPIIFSRYGAFEDVDSLVFPQDRSHTKIQVKETIFSYPNQEEGIFHFTLNFADAHLFGFYGGSLFAQDEMQVMEHPILGALRERLLVEEKKNPGLKPLTVSSEPTPCVVLNAERRFAINTLPTQNNPYGLYGHQFARAPFDYIKDATTIFKNTESSSVPLSHILAISSIGYQHGKYTSKQLQYIFSTVFTGFMACKKEAEKEAIRKGWKGKPRVFIHTGHLGCGAFGGDMELMSVLQIAAAYLSGIDELVYCTVHKKGTQAVEKGLKVLDNYLDQKDKITVAHFLKTVESLGYVWGQSNGT